MRCDEIEKVSVNNSNIHRFTYRDHIHAVLTVKIPR